MACISSTDTTRGHARLRAYSPDREPGHGTGWDVRAGMGQSSGERRAVHRRLAHRAGLLMLRQRRFDVTDPERLRALVDAHSWVTLTSWAPGDGLVVSHLPVIVDPARGRTGSPGPPRPGRRQPAPARRCGPRRIVHQQRRRRQITSVRERHRDYPGPPGVFRRPSRTGLGRRPPKHLRVSRFPSGLPGYRHDRRVVRAEFRHQGWRPVGRAGWSGESGSSSRHS